MNADNALARDDTVAYAFDRFRVGRRAEQKSDCVARNLKAGIQNHNRYKRTDYAVKRRKVNEFSDYGGCDYRRCGDDVIGRVARGGKQKA